MKHTDQQTMLISAIRAPRICLRPIRRKEIEYLELVDSIRADGVLQPILIRPVNDPDYSYEVVEGWHRLEAAKEAGLKEIPYINKELTDHEVRLIQVKCNSIRPITRTFEYARRLKRLMEDGLTLTELSAMLNKNPKWIKDQIQLNRLCDKARPYVERGEIKLTSALALANLPGDLQDKFVDDAVAMQAGEFIERAKAARRDFQSYLLRMQAEDRENGAARPSLRQLNVLKSESLKPTRAKPVLKAVGAKTPLDGWVACLQWMFRLDPISVQKRKAGRKRKDRDEIIRLNNDEYRKMNREMIKRFVTDNSKSGDQKNGK